MTTNHDNKPCATRDCLKKKLQKIEETSNTLFKWFCNYIVANVFKCHFLTSNSEEVGVKIENEIFRNFLQENLLGIVIDNRLTFKPHEENLYKKTRPKLQALAKIANYMR